MKIIYFIILLIIILVIRFFIKKKRRINKINKLFYNKYYFKQFDEISLNWKLISQEVMKIIRTQIKDNLFNIIVDQNLQLHNYNLIPLTVNMTIKIPKIIYAGFIFINPYSGYILETKKETFLYILGLNLSSGTSLISKRNKINFNSGDSIIHNSNYNLIINNNTTYDNVFLIIRFKR